MSKEIGVVKNVTQGSVKAVSLTGESRELKVISRRKDSH